jgi:hypothetical protein
VKHHPLVVKITQAARPNYDVYVGRPSTWGNPFRSGRDGTRAEVIAKYEALVRSQPEFMARIKRDLKGKILGCYCAPLPCHANILATIANEEP